MTVNLFVSPDDELEGADGSYDLPFKHLVKALRYANMVVAPYEEGIINIYLLKGDHYMSRANSNYEFRQTAKDQYSSNQRITIQPAF
jgi:hypothetical protein